MCISGVFKTSYFSLAAGLIHLVEDYCEDLDTRLAQNPRHTKCDAIKVTLLKALIKRVAAIAIIVISCADLFMGIALLLVDARYTRNIPGTLATMVKSVACIITGQLPGVVYDLYWEGIADAVDDMVKEPLTDDWIYRPNIDDEMAITTLLQNFDKSTRNLKRILRNSPLITTTAKVTNLESSIDSLITWNNSLKHRLTANQSIERQIIEPLMKHQRGRSAYSKMILENIHERELDVNWQAVEDAILGERPNNNDLRLVLSDVEAFPSPDYTNNEHFFQRKKNSISSLLKKALLNTELDNEIAQNIIKVQWEMQNQPQRHLGIEESMISLLNHKQFNPGDPLYIESLRKLALSPHTSVEMRNELLRKFLEMIPLRDEEALNAPLSPQAVEIIFKLNMKLDITTGSKIDSDVQRFYVLHRKQIAAYLHSYADGYLTKSVGSLEYKTENVRKCLNSLTKYFPLTEGELKAIFKAAVVIFDFELVDAIIKDPIRCELLTTEFIIATFQQISNVINVKRYKPIENRLDIFLVEMINRRSNLILSSYLSPRQTHRVYSLINQMKDTAMVRAWVTLNSHQGIELIEINFFMSLINQCQNMEALFERIRNLKDLNKLINETVNKLKIDREDERDEVEHKEREPVQENQAETKQKIESEEEIEQKFFMENGKKIEEEAAVFRDKFLKHVVRLDQQRPAKVDARHKALSEGLPRVESSSAPIAVVDIPPELFGIIGAY